MRAMLPVLLAAAALPFWEAKPPAEWTDEELNELLTRSPWTQQVVCGRSAGVLVYLATARPLRDAEVEVARRAREKSGEEPDENEYADFLLENEGKCIVLAVTVPNRKALDDPAEVKVMEERCVLRVGRNSYKMTGHFPPSASDPLLRLVFPKAVGEHDKSFTFELYVPGAREPLCFAEFKPAELRYKGRPEM